LTVVIETPGPLSLPDRLLHQHAMLNSLLKSIRDSELCHHRGTTFLNPQLLTVLVGDLGPLAEDDGPFMGVQVDLDMEGLGIVPTIFIEIYFINSNLQVMIIF
jgi:hypothetical protein